VLVVLLLMLQALSHYVALLFLSLFLFLLMLLQALVPFLCMLLLAGVVHALP
jgi:hypothetical protein